MTTTHPTPTREKLREVTPGPLSQIRPGEVRIYFAVPTCYTIGDTFASYKEASDAARASIQTFKYGEGVPDGKSRAFVDVRLADETGDRLLHRVEIFESSAKSCKEDVTSAISAAEKEIERLRNVMSLCPDCHEQRHVVATPTKEVSNG